LPIAKNEDYVSHHCGGRNVERGEKKFRGGAKEKMFYAKKLGSRN